MKFLSINLDWSIKKYIYVVDVSYTILQSLGIDDSKKDMLEVIKGLISSDILGLSQGEFTNLVKDALNHVHAKQEEELRKQQEEHEEQAKKLADPFIRNNSKLY